MATKRGQLLWVGAVLALVSMLSADIASAQEEMGEVVVTARKRDEAFRDVPVTINVFTEETIAAAGIERPSDYIGMVPNMTLVETQNAGNAFVVIRGISQARNSEPSVAVLIDGVAQTNPAQFNQELYDIQQIEVLKGPQGGLYGRNAIGGAILITTAPPSETFEGSVKLGVGNESSYRAQGDISGPLSDTLRYRASVSYYETDGFLDNEFLGGKADPVEDLSGRLRLLWEPSDAFSADLRLGASKLETRALYFVIPRADEANVFSIVSDANNTSTPITLDNPGINDRDLLNAALKLDFNMGGGGTLTSITSYDDTEEILTGDAFDFRPEPQSFFFTFLPIVGGPATDLNQSQFLDVQAYSQELRFTSDTSGRVRWIAGAYYVHTDRFISTGNNVDNGQGVIPVYETPSTNPANPSFTFLADEQDQDAWSVFADVAIELTERFEIDAAVRYDEDKRENTTKTPPGFLPDPSAFTGEVREHTWSETQPKLTLRYKPSENITFYGGYSRGFRSGGFNQTGVGAVADAQVPPVFGVNDLFEAEVADTYELGFKGQFMDERLNLGLTLFQTESENSYFFVFLAANSTQNLGNLDADYEGGEIELNARPTDRLDLYLSYGYTDSEITDMEDPSVIGNEAPLVSRYTANAGVQYRLPLGDALDLTFRVDYQKIGETWWEPYNVTSRDPIDLVDARVSLGAENWTATAWGKNLNDEEYNTEFSPGGFLFKALPQRYGVEFQYKF